MRTPWIEALRKSREATPDFSTASDGGNSPKLAPKRMSESYTRIVLPLEQDPWLLDSYANASGQIRCVLLLCSVAQFLI